MRDSCQLAFVISARLARTYAVQSVLPACVCSNRVRPPARADGRNFGRSLAGHSESHLSDLSAFVMECCCAATLMECCLICQHLSQTTLFTQVVALSVFAALCMPSPQFRHATINSASTIHVRVSTCASVHTVHTSVVWFKRDGIDALHDQLLLLLLVRHQYCRHQSSY